MLQESLVAPGKPERGKIAILVPGSSSLWNTQNRGTYFEQETYSLYFALTHAYGVPVDFVDEIEVANGALNTNDYYALYVTAPNVAAAAQTAVADLGGFCNRNPDVCVTGGAAIDVFAEKAENGVEMIYRYFDEPADAEEVVQALLALPGDKAEPPENPMSADRVRWEHIQRIYELCDRNVSETARRLNMHRRTLQRILAKRAPR